MKRYSYNLARTAIALILLACAVTRSHAGEDATSFPVYEPSWESLNQHEIPDWLLDAKLGLYGHWGIYSVPAFKTEWYGRLMYDKQTRGDAVFNHHVEKYGKQSEFGYKDFIKDFKAEKFDPKEWANLIVKAGAKYAGITVVHHDGFCLWDSKYTRWDAKDMVNGEGIYGTRRWKIETEGPTDKLLYKTGTKTMWSFADNCDAGDVRFTQSGNHLFAFILDWPQSGEVLIKALKTAERVSASNEIRRISLLGSDARVDWKRRDDGLWVRFPKDKPCEYAHGLKIEIDGDLITE